MNEKRKTYKRNTVIFIALLVVFFLLFPVLQVFSIVGIAICVVMLFIASNNIKKLDNAYKEETLPRIMNEFFTLEKYDPKAQNITVKDYKETEKPTGNIFSANDYFKAKLDDVDFEYYDCLVQQRTSNGKTTTTVTLFEGMVLKVAIDYQLNGRLKISERHQQKFFTNYQEIDLENIEFNRQFQVLADDKIDAFYILKPQVMEMLMELEKKHPGNLFFAYLHGYFYLTFNKRGNFEITDGYSEEQEELFRDDLREIDNFIKTIRKIND